MTTGYKQFVWRTVHIKWMRENLHLTDKEMADHIGTTPIRVYSIRRRYKISKPNGGWTTRFKPRTQCEQRSK